MYVVYILESDVNRRHYIGHTADIYRRLTEHNAGKVRSTKAYRPWKVILTEPYATKTEAFRREMEIKSYRSGDALRRLIQSSS